ncbi:MAG: polysaccharide deacetylase family protein, partial [Wenzhouxiangellaceae bacterium]
MRVRFNWRCLVLAFSLLSACTSSSSAYEPHAVILLYHHVSEQTPASTSVTPAQFERHLDYLAENDYRVWPLARALDAVLRGAEEIPDRVVAITFDDAYDSVHSRAHPSLVERNWPYTVFVNTNAVDAGHSPYMSWDQLRDLADQGAAIENHSAAHGHMSRPRAGESERDWRERIEQAGEARRQLDAQIASAAQQGQKATDLLGEVTAVRERAGEA